MTQHAKLAMQTKPKAEESTFRTKFGTEKLFVPHEFCWWMLGQKPGRKSRGVSLIIWYLYAAVVNIIFPIAYPVHLMIGIFQVDSYPDFFSNLNINITCNFASVKSFIIWSKFNRIREMQEIMFQLDERIILQEDVNYYKQTVFTATRHIAQFFFFFCFGCFMSAGLMVIIGGLFGDWRLLYPAYFPFDPYDSTWLYLMAISYQWIGLSIHIVQNFINDTFGAMCMAYLSGHVRLLSRRVARIGWDKSTTSQQNNQLLIQCIRDHELLIRFRHKLVEIVSYCLLFQISIAGISMCLAIIYMLFFIQDAFTMIYYVIYFFAIPMEIYPISYYGTKLQLEFEALTNAIYHCNWEQQNKDFRQNMRIFTEITLRTLHIEAGGMVRVNLGAFLSACKLAYSLYSVVARLK